MFECATLVISAYNCNAANQRATLLLRHVGVNSRRSARCNTGSTDRPVRSWHRVPPHQETATSSTRRISRSREWR